MLFALPVKLDWHWGISFCSCHQYFYVKKNCSSQSLGSFSLSEKRSQNCLNPSSHDRIRSGWSKTYLIDNKIVLLKITSEHKKPNICKKKLPVFIRQAKVTLFLFSAAANLTDVEFLFAVDRLVCGLIWKHLLNKINHFEYNSIRACFLGARSSYSED